LDSRHLTLSRKEGMGEFQNFAEMLEKKIRQELISEMQDSGFQSTVHPASSPTVETSYPYMSWLLGQIPISKSTDARHGALKSFEKTPYIRCKKVVPMRPAHILTAIQRQAFDFLKRYSNELPENFGGNDLRKAYRKALLLSHPDQGGSNQAFWEVQQAYQTLKSISAKV
jgi:hypothetical protein